MLGQLYGLGNQVGGLVQSEREQEAARQAYYNNIMQQANMNYTPGVMPSMVPDKKTLPWVGLGALLLEALSPGQGGQALNSFNQTFQGLRQNQYAQEEQARRTEYERKARMQDALTKISGLKVGDAEAKFNKEQAKLTAAFKRNEDAKVKTLQNEEIELRSLGNRWSGANVEADYRTFPIDRFNELAGKRGYRELTQQDIEDATRPFGKKQLADIQKKIDKDLSNFGVVDNTVGENYKSDITSIAKKYKLDPAELPQIPTLSTIKKQINDQNSELRKLRLKYMTAKEADRIESHDVAMAMKQLQVDALKRKATQDASTNPIEIKIKEADLQKKLKSIGDDVKTIEDSALQAKKWELQKAEAALRDINIQIVKNTGTKANDSQVTAHNNAKVSKKNLEDHIAQLKSEIGMSAPATQTSKWDDAYELQKVQSLIAAHPELKSKLMARYQENRKKAGF